MPRATISINVDAEAAAAFHHASDQERRKIEILLGLYLKDLLFSEPRPLREVLDEISRHAPARGLTPEILEDILKEPC